jgi:asparagine synthase (glutamine-hydrolysing)
LCRIAGIVNDSLAVEELHHCIRAMCESQKHGGPDDEGIFTDETVRLSLGHRRLSLIDLSPGGHQPMFYNDGSLVITYNGELYNYLQLKEELKYLGYRFASTSDTEVILAAFAEWGTSAFKRFNGMFAFALFNRETKKVYLVRDAAGIKPLYYSTRNGNLVFASEIKAFQYLDETRDENPDWPVYFMAYGHLPEPITTLRHVSPLPKGFFLEYDLLIKKTSLEAFTYFSFLEKINDRDEAIAKIRQCLQASVKRHLLSDAPIGAFLSGGIDSSLISLLAGAQVKDYLNTLSIYFREDVYSEKKYQDLVLQKLQCNHTGHMLTGGEFTEFLPEIIGAMDMPSCDGINTWFISKFAKEAGVKAVLSGLGGDELFGGYPSFERLKAAATLQKLPNSTLKAGRYSGLKKLRRLAYLSLPGIKGKYLFLRGQFIPTEIAAQLGIEEGQVWKLLHDQPVMPDVHYLTPKNQASWMEMNLYMQNQLLRDSDVMSMAHGIEIRVPFLDAEFIRLALQISSTAKYAGEGKQLLIDAFKDILPEPIYNRPKMGFAFPFKEWLAANTWVKEQILTSDKEAKKTYDLFVKGQRHWSQVLVLLLAKKQRFEKEPAVSYA